MFDIKINQMWLKSYGVNIEKRPDIPSPLPKYKEVEIPGRDGTFREWDKTYNDIVIELKCNYISNPKKWGKIWRKIKNDFLGKSYRKNNWIMILSDDQDYCYKIKNIELSINERNIIQSGSFSMKITCDQYMYITNEQLFVEFVNGEHCNNLYSATYPIFKINAEGYCYVAVDDNKIEFNATGEIIIDTELKIAYRKNKDIFELVPTKGDFDKLILTNGMHSLFISNSSSTAMIKKNYRSL